MPTLDNDCVIRDRAYRLWQRAGCPSGLEHEHWAEARRQVEAETSSDTMIDDPGLVTELSNEPSYPSAEVVRLRQALYTPEPFSFELFGSECPTIDLPIVIRQVA